MIVLLFLLASVALVAGLVIERRRLDRAHAIIPLRIAVTGTRGKTSVARLQASVLRYAWALIVAAACGGPASPTSPSPAGPQPDAAVATDFHGLWTGVWSVDYSGIDWIRPGTQYEYLLRLTTLGPGLDGYLVMPNLNNGELTSNVTGVMGPDHRVTLSGYTPAAGSNDATVTFVMTLWFSGGALGGQVSYQAEGAYRHNERLKGTVMTAVRGVEPAATFEGTWRGRYLVEACELIGWDQCHRPNVGESREVELVLFQSGGLVTGTFHPTYSRDQHPGSVYVIDVSGPAAGNAVQLAGTSPYYPDNRDVTRRLLAFSATRDAVGRLTGTLTWQEDSVGSGTANFGVLHRTTRTGVLHEVVQVR